MITNTLLIKLNSYEEIEKTKFTLLSMKGEIPVLKYLQVETDIRRGTSSYDILLITKFNSLKDMETYLSDPVHLEVSKYIATVMVSGASVCYED